MVKLKIISHEDKTSKGGKDYTRFNTSQGWMSVFETEIIESLKNSEGKEVDVEVAESDDGKFKNIRKILTDEESSKAETVISGSMKHKGTYEPTSMYVSYAKDVLVELLHNVKDWNTVNIDALIEQSIKAVKQAREAFE